MKIVLVTSIPAFPTNAGNRSRILELARAVRALGHDLTFVSLPVSKDQGDIAAHQAEFGAQNYVQIANSGFLQHRKYRLHQKHLKLQQKRLQKRGDDNAHYSKVDQTHNDVWLPKLKAIGRDADVVIVEYVFNSKVFEAFPRSAMRILDTHDSFSDRHKLFFTNGLGNGYWRSLRPEDEILGFRRADTVLAIQEEEAIRFSEQLQKNPTQGATPDVAVVSHFLDTRTPITDYSQDNTAFFLGSNNPANRQAISNFVATVMPLVVQEIPTFDLKLIGGICKDAPDHPNITKLGQVPKLRDAFVRSPLSINPMLVGTGINIKLLDAMAAGVATLSTATGLRGLPDRYRQGVVAFDDHDHVGFANEIIRYAQSAELRARIGGAALSDAEKWNQEQYTRLRICLERHTQTSSQTDARISA